MAEKTPSKQQILVYLDSKLKDPEFAEHLFEYLSQVMNPSQAQELSLDQISDFLCSTEGAFEKVIKSFWEEKQQADIRPERQTAFNSIEGGDGLHSVIFSI